jgi:outer membrane immunogenic protein
MAPVFFREISHLEKSDGRRRFLFEPVCPPRNSISGVMGYIAAHQARESPTRMAATAAYLGDLDMKKFLLASVALVALTGAASAADLAARPYTKAPMVAPAALSWTGFYIFGGAGGGIWDADQHSTRTIGGITTSTIDSRVGGDGWFGTVGLGYDWQVNPSWVIGAFADGQFGSLRGNVDDVLAGFTGRIKMEDAWAVGARVGYLVAPNVLSYVNAGYSGSHWSGSTLVSAVTGNAAGFHTDSFNRNGWFVGGGVENNLNIFGISAPGWFMKTEYRAAYYDRKDLNVRFDATNALSSDNISFKPWVQTISTSLVYRFNWTGPVVAKY